MKPTSRQLKELIDSTNENEITINRSIANDLDLEYTQLEEENKNLQERVAYLQRSCGRKDQVRDEQYEEIIDLETKIDNAVKYIDNLRDESAERQGFYNCFPDDLYIADINELLDILKEGKNDR